MISRISLLAVLLLVATHAVAQTTNVTGEWAFNVTTHQGGGTVGGMGHR